jgi:NTE family protein
MFVGTSAGAMNAALFASLAHLPARQAATQALALWGNMKQSDVFPPAVPSVLAAVPQYIARLFGVGRGMTSLLNTKPLLRLLTDKLDWHQLHQNVEAGEVEALAIVTTAMATDRTSVFVEHSQAIRVLPGGDGNRAIDYYEQVIDANAVRASAIPALFPPVLLGAYAASPQQAARHEKYSYDNCTSHDPGSRRCSSQQTCSTGTGSGPR